MDQRRDTLAHWAATEINRLKGVSPEATLDVVSGDASFRRYFRLRHQGHSWICVDAPPDKEDNPRFVRIACAWHEHGVHVPAVLATDFEQGFMLLEDFGDRLLWPAVHDGAGEAVVLDLYSQAQKELLAIQQLPVTGLPAYDDVLLRQEMALFPDWLCEQQLGLTLTDECKAVMQRAFDLLVDNALAQPTVAVHRDYHSRNLMLCAGDRIGVIDFQDAVAGPLTYDLVSLLRDCYVRWPSAWVDTLVSDYYQAAVNAGLYKGSLEEFQRHFDLMGMQRHLKAAGIFARLNIRDGKPGYLADIPNTCTYLREVAGRYPEFANFCAWLDDRFLPQMEQHLS